MDKLNDLYRVLSVMEEALTELMKLSPDSCAIVDLSTAIENLGDECAMLEFETEEIC